MSDKFHDRSSPPAWLVPGFIPVKSGESGFMTTDIRVRQKLSVLGMGAFGALGTLRLGGAFWAWGVRFDLRQTVAGQPD